MTDGSFYISKVLPNSAAQLSQALNIGDHLLSVTQDEEPVDVQGKMLGEVTSMIRGPVGTEVTLELRRKGQEATVKVSLTREPIRIKGVATYRDFIDKKSPDLVFSTLDDSNEKVTLASMSGRVVVLDFWASWCGTCYRPVDNLQEISRLHPEWKGKVEFVAVSVDVDREKAKKVIRERKWNRTTNVLIDYEALTRLGIRALPALVIVSSEGKIEVMGGSHAIDVVEEVERLL